LRTTVLKVRIIPTLLYRDFGLVKGVRFDSRRAVGSPVQAIKVYDVRGVDELVFLDVTATRRGRGPDFALIDELADECFMPLTVGGGIRTIDDVRGLLRVGADKVAINTAAVENPQLVQEAAQYFGTQCITVSIDTKVDAAGDAATVWTRSGTTPTGLDPVEHAVRMQALGAGEILLTSVDRDGTMEGYDIDTLRRVSEAVTIPVIASGGAGTYKDMGAAIIDGKASAVAAAAIFHFTEQTPAEAKRYLRGEGVPVRL
jgi:cyclase